MTHSDARYRKGEIIDAGEAPSFTAHRFATRGNTFFSHLLDVLISISIEINVRDLEKYIRGGEIYLFLQFVSKLCPVIA